MSSDQVFSPPEKPTRSRTPVWLLFGFAIAVALVFGLAASLSNSPSAEDKAITACEKALTDQLRDPESVEFGDRSAEQGEKGETDWLVVGEYRARNGFGGMNSDAYFCTTDPDGSNAEIFTGESMD